MEKNIGDTIELILNYQVNGEPIKNNEYEEIEFIFGNSKFLLSKEEIIWDETQNAYKVFLNQEDTFKLRDKIINYQIRFKKDNEVFSSKIQQFNLGETLSYRVI